MELSAELKINTEVQYFNSVSDLDSLFEDEHFFIVDESVSGNFTLPEENTFRVHGEEDKEMESVLRILKWLYERGADRSSRLWGIGGGATTDIAGFVSSIYKRGLALGLVPTTLLAAADSAIGGKNGVNMGAKNVVGTFYPAFDVVVVEELLRNLPRGEVLNGYVEILKMAFLSGGALLDMVFAGDDLLSEAALLEAVRLKGLFVEDDLFDRKGQRMALNYGHTFGHGIERYYDIPHGEAVAYGIYLAQALALSCGRSAVDPQKAVTVFEKYGIKLENLKRYIENPEWLEFLKHDKKASGATQRIVFLEKFGKYEILEIEYDCIKTFMEEMQ